MIILIAEDTAEVRRMYVRRFKLLGHEVLEAKNGEEAWQILRTTEKVDLLVTDKDMPVMGGLELCLNIKESGIKIKIVMVSGREKPENLPEDVVFLYKPAMPKEILEAVKV